MNSTNVFSFSHHKALHSISGDIDTSLLVDKEYVTHSDRTSIKTASFSPVSDLSTLEDGDLILMFATMSDYDAIKEASPYIRFSPLWQGIVDATSKVPILIEIKKIHSFSETPLEIGIKTTELSGIYGTSFKQIWRYIG